MAQVSLLKRLTGGVRAGFPLGREPQGWSQTATPQGQEEGARSKLGLCSVCPRGGPLRRGGAPLREEGPAPPCRSRTWSRVGALLQKRGIHTHLRNLQRGLRRSRPTPQRHHHTESLVSRGEDVTPKSSRELFLVLGRPERSAHGLLQRLASCVKLIWPIAWNTAHKTNAPGFGHWVGKIPWRRAMQPPPAFLPGESHGPRSLVGYSPWGPKESDTTELLTLSSFFLIH